MTPVHDEIERRFLIRYPDIEALRRLPGFAETRIEQHYLPSPDGVTERVRRREDQYACVYTHTVKRHVSDMRREEDEREISREEYERLRARTNARALQKTRLVFQWDGQVYELDLYPFWTDRAILEAEIANENTDVRVPPFLTLIREVTSERAYGNASLSARVPMEEI